MSGRLLIDGTCEPIENMARDEALLQSCDRGAKGFPVLRFYQWSVPTLSLGAKEQLTEAADVEACKAAGIEIVRRTTGGRAVLHHEEITYSISAPRDLHPFDRSVTDSYRAIAEAIRMAISNLGIELDLTTASRKISPRSNLSGVSAQSPKDNSAKHLPCFAAPSRYELAYNGKKVVGSAQRRFRNAVLQHGSILLKSNVEMLAIATGANQSTTEALNRSMIGLEEITPFKISIDSLVEHLVESLEKTFGTPFKQSTFSETENDLLTELRAHVSARISL